MNNRTTNFGAMMAGSAMVSMVAMSGNFAVVTGLYEFQVGLCVGGVRAVTIMRSIMIIMV